MASKSSVAGFTNYGDWDRVASDLLESAEADEEKEAQESSKALGLDGKYAFSQAEKQEREKAMEVLKTKKTLDRYQRREELTMQRLSSLFPDNDKHVNIVRITRDSFDAGKRVATLSDTTGQSREDMVVFTQDLSHLESSIQANAMQPKTYKDDAENSVTDENDHHHVRKVYGLIKLFISNVHNCTIVIRCKLITGTVEMTRCSNVSLVIEKEATVATLQVDLCNDITVEYRDAPSGKNIGIPGKASSLFWGDDKNDRIFHAGVKSMHIKLVRDGYVETEKVADYVIDGAESVGNATKTECQFVTSVVGGELMTEKVIRTGSSTGRSDRAMTQRELNEEQVEREKVQEMMLAKAEQSIKFVQKTNKPKVKNLKKSDSSETCDQVEEVYTAMSKADIDRIVSECEENKARGNESFGSGEYAQAVLLYTLALDKSAELPGDGAEEKLFARNVVLSNRSAAFLKLGQHEKALEDATNAQERDPTYVKAVFRKGLALHAMGRYQEAIIVLAEAQKLEPNNKQIKQALQFCEVRLMRGGGRN